MELESDDDALIETQANIIHDLSERIAQAMSYLDWLASTDEVDEAYIEQLIKILDGDEYEH